jgi:hypothetical protein
LCCALCVPTSCHRGAWSPANAVSGRRAVDGVTSQGQKVHHDEMGSRTQSVPSLLLLPTHTALTSILSQPTTRRQTRQRRRRQRRPLRLPPELLRLPRRRPNQSSTFTTSRQAKTRTGEQGLANGHHPPCSVRVISLFRPGDCTALPFTRPIANIVTRATAAQ